jgi:hypothetical protein
VQASEQATPAFAVLVREVGLRIERERIAVAARRAARGPRRSRAPRASRPAARSRRRRAVPRVEQLEGGVRFFRPRRGLGERRERTGDLRAETLEAAALGHLEARMAGDEVREQRVVGVPVAADRPPGTRRTSSHAAIVRMGRDRATGGRRGTARSWGCGSRRAAACGAWGIADLGLAAGADRAPSLSKIADVAVEVERVEGLRRTSPARRCRRAAGPTGRSPIVTRALRASGDALDAHRDAAVALVVDRRGEDRWIEADAHSARRRTPARARAAQAASVKRESGRADSWRRTVSSRRAERTAARPPR